MRQAAIVRTDVKHRRLTARAEGEHMSTAELVRVSIDRALGLAEPKRPILARSVYVRYRNVNPDDVGRQTR